MPLLLYGNGGLAGLPSTVEEEVLDGAVGEAAKAETVATHTSTAIDGITPVLTSADVGKKIFAADIPFGTTIVAVAGGGASATLSDAATATAAAHNAIVYPSTGLAGAKVMLFTDDLTPPYKDLVVSDLTEATYDGYARSSACSWSPPFQDANGNALVSADKKQFVCTGSSTDNAIAGAALVSPDGLTLLQVDVFVDSTGVPAKVNMGAAGDGFDYVPVCSLV